MIYTNTPRTQVRRSISPSISNAHVQNLQDVQSDVRSFNSITFLTLTREYHFTCYHSSTFSNRYCAGLCVVSFFGMWAAYHFFDYSKSGGEVMVSDENDEERNDDVETKSEDSLRDPLLNEQKEKDDDVTLNVKDDDFDLGFKPVELVFKDLKYTVTIPKTGRDKVLLQNINGYATPGRLTALMGSTGAGKSTLLDVLAGRKNTGKIEGTVTTNGFLKNDDVFATVCGYVEQVDIHSPTSTVLEALNFSAKLRLPSNVSPERRDRFVQNWLRKLDLTPIQHRRIGSLDVPGGLSIEQRKRVTIGVELVANPSVVFLDEPTSGLDSRAAMIVRDMMFERLHFHTLFSLEIIYFNHNNDIHVSRK